MWSIREGVDFKQNECMNSMRSVYPNPVTRILTSFPNPGKKIRTSDLAFTMNLFEPTLPIIILSHCVLDARTKGIF